MLRFIFPALGDDGSLAAAACISSSLVFAQNDSEDSETDLDNMTLTNGGEVWVVALAQNYRSSNHMGPYHTTITINLSPAERGCKEKLNRKEQRKRKLRLGIVLKPPRLHG